MERFSKISFGGIPNSSSIDIPCGQSYPRDQNNHMAAPVKVARQQTTPELSGTLRNLPNPASGTYTNTRRNSSEPSGTIQTLPPEPTPTRAGTLQNPPEPSETFRNQPFGTFRNLPEPTSWTYASIHRNPPKSSGTCLRNLHHFTPEPSGTFRNLPPEPTPAHAGTLRNLPEPSSGTCSCDPHRHTPELIWAEDPISLRCWGKTVGFWILSGVQFFLDSNKVQMFPQPFCFPQFRGPPELPEHPFQKGLVIHRLCSEFSQTRTLAPAPFSVVFFWSA